MAEEVFVLISLVLKTNRASLTTCFQGSQTCSASSDMVIDKIGCTVVHVKPYDGFGLSQCLPTKSHQKCCFL